MEEPLDRTENAVFKRESKILGTGELSTFGDSGMKETRKSGFRDSSWGVGFRFGRARRRRGRATVVLQ